MLRHLGLMLVFCLGLGGCGDVPSSVLDVVLPDAELAVQAEGVEVSQLTQAALERLYREPGVLHSPIPDDVYSALWGDLEQEGDASPRGFYTKYMDADGIAIVGDDKVDDRLFHVARGIIRVMTSKMPAIREALSTHGPEAIKLWRNVTDIPVGAKRFPVRFRVILVDVVNGTPKLPEYPDIRGDMGWFPGFILNAAAVMPVGWYPHFPDHPVSYGLYRRFADGDERGHISVAGKGIGYMGGHGTFVHEFAHSIHLTAFRRRPDLFPNFEERLMAAYAAQMERIRLQEELGIAQDAVRVAELTEQGEVPWTQVFGLCWPYKETYGYTNVLEFWAEAVQDWFGSWHYPDVLAADPTLEEAGRRCGGDLVDLLSEVFPRFYLDPFVYD